MEVCIFGVLTVNLLTFSSQNAPLPSERPLSRCLLKKTAWALAEKKLKLPATARFTGLYEGWHEA